MGVFHIGDKVFLDNRDNIRPRKYGKIMNIDTQNNLIRISLIDDDIPFYININSPKINKIDFLPKDYVIIHDLLKDYCNKRGVISAYDRTIDRYRVIIDNDPNPHWFAPFELSLEDESGLGTKLDYRLRWCRTNLKSKHKIKNIKRGTWALGDAE